MQTTHAKAIKYLGIATIVLAGLTILGCLIGFVATSALSAYSSAYYPVAGYGHHGMMMSGGYSSDYMGMVVAANIFGGLLFWKLACAVVALIAGIMAVRMKEPTAHGLHVVFIWAIIGAICSLLAGSLITMALLIVVAVFAEMDRRALEAPAAAAPQQTVPAATVTAAPANTAYAAAYGDDIQPVAASAVATAVTEAPVDQKSGPAVAENEAIAEEATAAAATYAAEASAVIEQAEVEAEGVSTDVVETVEVVELNDDAATAADAAVAEEAHIAEEGEAAADFYKENAEAVTEAAEDITTADPDPKTMEAEGEAEELKADEELK